MPDTTQNETDHGPKRGRPQRSNIGGMRRAEARTHVPSKRVRAAYRKSKTQQSLRAFVEALARSGDTYAVAWLARKGIFND